METVDHEWILHGADPDDPGRIRSADEALQLINTLGFLPFFKNHIPGFSLEERTLASDWWTGDPERDPWTWRCRIAESRKAAYGKFFQNKAGFISLECLPLFAALRRDAYDFDALWEDEKASLREKRIMDLFREKPEYLVMDIKRRAGFTPGGEKNFNGVITALEMKTYLVVTDFRQRLNKKGLPYGWHVSVYAQPESIWGYDLVTGAYAGGAQKAKAALLERAKRINSGIAATEWEKML